MSDERGLVISPPIEISGGSILVKSPDLDPQELRFNLLFWDKLDFPEQFVIGFNLGPDSQFLIESKILQRTRVQVPGGRGGDILRAVHVGAFRVLDEKEPGQWSIATGERSISFLDDDLETGKGALVHLHRAIPVPDKDVPLQDILEFRTKRRSELLALRHHLERIYQRVITAGDGELALKTEVEALDQAIADHIKASKESGLRFRGMSFGANLNLIAVGAAAKLAYEAGLGVSGALVAGVATLAIGPSVSLSNHKATPTPFRYVSAFHKELF